MDELTPDELDEAVEQEARRIEAERSKRRLLALLEGLPADSPLWDWLLVVVTGKLLLEAREESEEA
ncbi:MAG: hypothetical protein ACOYXO_03445 [Chloroflexota bacterium]